MKIDQEPLTPEDDPFAMATPVPTYLPDPLALVIPDDEVTQALPLMNDDPRARVPRRRRAVDEALPRRSPTLCR
jgi:hypothetical protein